MTHENGPSERLLSRRDIFRYLGATGVVWLMAGSLNPRLSEAGTLGPSCVVRPEQMEGPYFVDERLNRSDIRSDPTDGRVKPGTPLALTLLVSRLGAGDCQPLPGAQVDIWHCDAQGVYSDVQDPEFNTAFLALGANRGLKGVGVFLSGPMAFVTRMPVRTLADLEGKKVRVLAAALQMEQMRRLKGTPVPMSLGEVMPALQQGTLDGFMSATPILAAMRFYDAAKYMYESKHAVVTSMTFISKNWFDKLPPDLQKVVVDSGREATKETFQSAIDFVAKQREVWLKAGGEITEPTPADHAQLMKLMLPIGAQVTARKPEEKALYELLLKAAKRTE